jgi:hypothetical protein
VGVVAVHQAGCAHGLGEGCGQGFLEALGGDDGELFDHEPVEVLALHLLASDEVKCERVESWPAARPRIALY